jgi:fructosamine-3-kinase
MWDSIAQQIQAVTGNPFRLSARVSVGGGCINQAFRISDDTQQVYFVKVNQANKAPMFAAEALGLQEMAPFIRVPRPLCWGTTSAQSYLVLEWIDLGRSRSVSFGESLNWTEMGQRLAALHRATHPQGFGWHQDNTIGETPQLNPWTQNWAEFFARYRIGHQLKLAAQKGARFAEADALLQAIPTVLAGHDPQPSLVHGDLWSGNAAFDTAGAPVILDPAPYYGDREVDLAMTSLFGGFPKAFYQGYQAAWPLSSGYQQRTVLYNLYHILNHFNLFGGSYASQAEQMMKQVLATV